MSDINQKHAMSALERKRKQREGIDFRNKEKEKMRKRREDIDFRNKEKEKMRIYERNKRANGDYRMNEIQRRKKARLEATPNYPRAAELMHGDKKMIHAAHVARYRFKIKCCTGGRYTEESPYEYECQFLFRRYMVFDLKFTRYEKKAFFAFSG